MSLYLNIAKTFYPFIFIMLAYFFNIVDQKGIILGYLSFCVYHFFTSKSRLFFTKNEKNDKILSSCPNVKDPQFKTHFLLPIGVLQLFAIKLLTIPVEITVERDNVHGCGIYLDWISGEIEIQKTAQQNKTQDVLVIIPGVTGNKDESYVKNLCYEGIRHGYITVVYQYRMLSSEIVLPENENLNLFADLEEALEKIQGKYPKAKIYAIGCSYGANKLVHFLGTRNLKKKLIHGAVSLSNPYEPLITHRYLEDTLYENFILSLLKDNLKKNIHLLASQNKKMFELDLDGATNSTSIKEYDECIMRRLLGYKSTDHYYRDFSCATKIENVDVPLLCISAKDDMITTSKAIPYDEVKLNHHVFLLVTDKGSHMCYISNESFVQIQSWLPKPTFEFLNAIREVQ